MSKNIVFTMLFAIISWTFAEINLIFPPNGACLYDATPNFDWEDVSGANEYLIQIDEDQDFTSPIVSQSVTSSYCQITEPLAETLYYWRVIIENPASETSEVFRVYIQTKGPDLILPLPDAEITDRRVQFIWHNLRGASEYNLKVYPSGSVTPDIDTVLLDTVVVPRHFFELGDYGWSVRAKDSFGNYSEDSETRFFTIQVAAVWQELESIPSRVGASKRNVKDGGALVAVGNILYAFRGNKSNEFYKYNGSWSACETLFYGPKETKPSQVNKKTVGKGAALCYSPLNNMIYATKGNGTKEFWAYDIERDTWLFKGFVPVSKDLKGGTSMTYYDGRIYLLAGAQKADPMAQNFFVYDINSTTWDTLNKAPVYTGKPYKDGSAIVCVGNSIYCLMGGANENYFSMYNISRDTWVRKSNLPEIHPAFPRKKTKVKDGAAIASDGSVIYAIKGGKVNEFWCYLPESDTWVGKETIPHRIINDAKYAKQSVPKTGAALTCDFLGNVYLLKGNGTSEFWKYTPQSAKLVIPPITDQSQRSESGTTIRKRLLSYKIEANNIILNYSVPYNTKIKILLVSPTGAIIKALKSGFSLEGEYSLLIPKAHLASGVYFIKYQSETVTESYKLVIR
ncbi:MAG: hypothetical protein ABIK10_03190 [candidate division WOR-3 bacterium]